MKVIYTAKRGVLNVVNGVDNTPVKGMINDFYANKINVNPITTKENGNKFNTVIHNGFEYSEEMLHEYCRMKTENGESMSYWGNLLSMIDLALYTNDGVCNIWDVNLILKSDVSILNEETPSFLPNSKIIDEDGVFVSQKLWKNWRGENNFFQNGNDIYFLTFSNGIRLNMAEIKQLKQYANSNQSFNMLFLSNTEFLAERNTWQ
jgi:hypothetical protein